MSDREIVVGVSLPNSGRYQPHAGVYYTRAYGMWERLINAAGGLLGRPVRLLVYDDASEEDRARENYRRLIHDDNVDLLLGPCHSNLTEACATVVEEAGRLLLQGSGSSHELFRKGREWLFLCWSGVDYDYPKSFMEFVSQSNAGLPRLRAALVYTDWRIGSAVALGTRRYAQEFGLDLVFDETIGDPPVDYAGLMRRAKAADPDVLMIGLDHVRADKPMHESVKAALDAGFQSDQIWLSDNPSPRDREVGGAIDGVFMRGSWVPEDRSPLSRRFTEDFQREFGSLPEYHSAGGYACCQVLQEAVTATGSCDSEMLRAHLLTNAFDTVMGSLRFTPDGMPSGTIQLCQWQAGRIEVVYPQAVATAKARLSSTVTR